MYMIFLGVHGQGLESLTLNHLPITAVGSNPAQTLQVISDFTPVPSLA